MEYEQSDLMIFPSPKMFYVCHISQTKDVCTGAERGPGHDLQDRQGPGADLLHELRVLRWPRDHRDARPRPGEAAAVLAQSAGGPDPAGC